jgi:hypothetical protein
LTETITQQHASILKHNFRHHASIRHGRFQTGSTGRMTSTQPFAAMRSHVAGVVFSPRDLPAMMRNRIAGSQMHTAESRAEDG